jgi:hypothetical protein
LTSKKGILCLEGLYDTEIDNDKRYSISAIINYVAKVEEIKHSHFDVGTVVELEHRLLETKKKGFSILYLSFHGTKSKTWIEDEFLSLMKLSEIMNDHFLGWDIHFGSCLTGTSEEVLLEFKKNVGARLVSAYNTSVGYIDSAALEIGWLSALVNGKRKLPIYYRGLIKQNGLVIV